MNIPDLDQFVEIRHILPAVGTWSETVHVFDPRSAQAIRAALASGRPLLVRGEPGTGKSQLARAAAKVLGRKFLSHVIDAHTEIQDLWYRFDAISRLGQAQVLSVACTCEIAKGATPQDPQQRATEQLRPDKFLSPGILWWAFDWQDAKDHIGEHPLFLPDDQDPGDESKGVVLLLDEVDKADSDLPNSLLETLDNGRFTVPWIKKSIGVERDGQIPPPLVLLTSNEDRQLPGAFVRRCLVLELRLPRDKEAMIAELQQCAAIHFPKKREQEVTRRLKRNNKGHLAEACRFDSTVLREAAVQLYQDRQSAETMGVTPPGRAEYLDMLRVLDTLVPAGDTIEQMRLLAAIKDFALKKYPDMQQEAAERAGHHEDV